MIGVGKARGITSKLDGPYSNPSPTKGYQAAALIVASSCGSGILGIISKVGSAYICKICKYIDLCIFCIFFAYFLHIFVAY